MSKKRFTAEEILVLKRNPYVERVSELSVSFTEEFKKKAHRELLAGKTMEQIFREQGIDTAALGAVRVIKFQQFIKKRADRESGFKNLRNTWRKMKLENGDASAGNRIKSLETEVAYLYQVVDFLKKIQQTDSEAKKQ